MVQVSVPRTAEQLDDVRDLMRAFVAWHRQRHQQDLVLIDSYFDARAFEAELAGLPGKYGRRLRFRDIAPYYDLPEALRNWLVFLEMSLQV